VDCREFDEGKLNKGKLKYRQNLYWAINNECSNNCDFCFNKGLKVTNDFDNSRQKLKKIKPFVHTITISGGEPLLARDWVKIYEDKPFMANIFETAVLYDGSHVPKTEIVTSAPRRFFLDEYERVIYDYNIIISRHAVSDRENERIFDRGRGLPLLSGKDLKNIIAEPGYRNNITLSCTLGEHGVNSYEEMLNYIKDVKKYIGDVNIIFNDLRPAPNQKLSVNLLEQFKSRTKENADFIDMSKNFVSSSGYEINVLQQNNLRQVVLKHYFDNPKEFEDAYKHSTHRTNDLSLTADGRLYKTWQNRPEDEILL
jgi:sulfatase maturation enzyme AslB (radical SAM superfamily)